MPELQLKPPARQCAVTDEDFAPGDAVVSYLLAGKDAYVRIDVKAVAAAGFVPPDPPLCRWTWEVRPAEDAARAAARATLAQSEELFLALCHADDAADPPAVVQERAALRHLLGLVLQRKRLLRPLRGEGHRYLHVPSGQEVLVPPVALSPALLQRVAPQMIT